MIEFQWNKVTIASVISEHYENLSASDKRVLQQIATRALRKTLSTSCKKVERQ